MQHHESHRQQIASKRQPSDFLYLSFTDCQLIFSRGHRLEQELALAVTHVS